MERYFQNLCDIYFPLSLQDNGSVTRVSKRLNFSKKRDVKLLNKFACHLEPVSKHLDKVADTVYCCSDQEPSANDWLGKEIPNMSTLRLVAHFVIYYYHTSSLLRMLLILINFNIQMVNLMFLYNIWKLVYIHINFNQLFNQSILKLINIIDTHTYAYWDTDESLSSFGKVTLNLRLRNLHCMYYWI